MREVEEDRLAFGNPNESEFKMDIQLHAQPYDLSAKGFFFRSVEEYDTKVRDLTNDYGDPVEEFEIQFIDGDGIDCELAKAIGLNQSNLAQFFESVEAWDTHQKTLVILAIGECGYRFDADTDPDDFDIDMYDVRDLGELAEQFVQEGLFGDIPERLEFYIDYEAIARDLAFDYAETCVAGQHFIYRAG